MTKSMQTVTEDQIVFKTTDPFERNIVLKQGTWEYKILNIHGTNNNQQHGNSHPEMKDYLQTIQDSIQYPHYIIKDVEPREDEHGQTIYIPSPNRENYIRFYMDEEAGQMKILKTVVEHTTQTQSEVVTTHKMRNIKDIKRKGGVIYDSSGKAI